MNTSAESALPTLASRSGLVKYLLLSILAAAVILVLFILPAEYGIDPTGLGRRMGLTALSGTAAVPVTENITLAPAENSHFYPAAFHSNVIEIPLNKEGAELEYKVRMKAGETIVYDWSVDNGVAYYDFHGESEPDHQVLRYKEEQNGASSGHGSLVAPFDGIHGWYWLNLEAQPVKITLRVSGFYELRPQSEQPVGVVKQ
jgi:hypothetical protein